MKKIIFFVLLIFLNICHAAENNKCNNDRETTYLFIHTAKNSILFYDKKNNVYELTLLNVHPWITYFSNAPKKETGFMTIKEYIEFFNVALKEHKSGLNAGFVAFTQDKHKTARYTFSFYKISYNKLNDYLTYWIKFLPGEQIYQKPKDSINFENTALFIDNVCASCGGRGF